MPGADVAYLVAPAELVDLGGITMLTGTLQVWMVDSTDEIAYTMWDDSGSLVFASRWVDTRWVLQTLNGGNIDVK